MAKHAKPAVAVVDDDSAVLHSVVRLLSVNGFDARAFSSPQSLLLDIDTLSPSCVVVDLSMPGITGLDLQRTLGDHRPDLPVIFITGHGDIRSSVQAMRAGAVDFLTKPIEHTELIDAVRRAVALAQKARETSGQLAAIRRHIDSLTPRERAVFEQVVAGRLNKQIAADLGISEKTVKVHRGRVMRKMRVRSAVQLARLAEQLGLHAPSK